MIGSKIRSLAQILTNTNATTFLTGVDEDVYEQLNVVYGQRILDILRVRVDKNASIQNATTDLISTAGLVEEQNGFNGEYSFPANLLKPSRFEVSYDGVTWKKCTIYDNALNNQSEYNDTQLAGQFSQASPMVDFSRNSYKIRPPKTDAGNITKGIYIEYSKRQADFTSTTAPTEIESNLQDILAYDLAELEFIQHPESHSNNQIQLFNKKKDEVEKRFLEFYKKRLQGNKTITFNLSRAN